MNANVNDNLDKMSMVFGP